MQLSSLPQRPLSIRPRKSGEIRRRSKEPCRVERDLDSLQGVQQPRAWAPGVQTGSEGVQAGIPGVAHNLAIGSNPPR